MKKIDYNELNSMHLDLLQEIGNIGSGNATTALSKLINKKIDMGVPQVKILEFKELSEIIGGADNQVVSILFRVKEDVNGMMMFVFEQSSAHHLVNLIMGKKIKDEEEFSEMDLSALQEIGNILSGAYLSSLSTLTNLKIVPSIPYMAIDMAGAVLSVPAIEFGKIGDQALLIQTTLGDQEDDEYVSGYFILIPELESFNTIMNRFGLA